MSDAPASLQIDLQNVVQRLGAQVGQLSTELATANEAIEVQQKKIIELAAKVPPEDSPKGKSA